MEANEQWVKSLGELVDKATAAFPDAGKLIAEAAKACGYTTGTPQLMLSDDEMSLISLGSGEVFAEFHIVNKKALCRCGNDMHDDDKRCMHAFCRSLLRRLKPDDKPAPEAITQTGVPDRYIQRIGNRPHILYDGLLALARQRWGSDGFTLNERWTYNDEKLSLAEAELRIKSEHGMNDGIWIGSGDATPENVSTSVRPHFRRMACTRAKARALRDALGVDGASAEEVV